MGLLSRGDPYGFQGRWCGLAIERRPPPGSRGDGLGLLTRGDRSEFQGRWCGLAIERRPLRPAATFGSTFNLQLANLQPATCLYCKRVRMSRAMAIASSLWSLPSWPATSTWSRALGSLPRMTVR